MTYREVGLRTSKVETGLGPCHAWMWVAVDQPEIVVGVLAFPAEGI